MEKPFYGRTGALENARQGIPVAASRFTAGRSCKWFPSLTTVPQRVLHSITDGDGVDRSVLRFLRVACIYEELRRRHADSTRHGALLRDVLKWHQASLNEAGGRCGVGDDNSGDDLFQPYIPAYNICVLKEGKQVGLHTAVSRRAVTLVGKDRAVNDILAEHPSCSAQHAALEVHFVFAHAEEFDQQITAWMRERKVDWNSSRDIEAVCVRLREMMEELGDDESAWTMELQVLDLGSTNGTRLNGELLQPSTPVTLIEGDVLTFGCSTRRQFRSLAESRSAYTPNSLTATRQFLFVHSTMPREYKIASLAERQAKYAPLFAAMRQVLPEPDKQLVLDPKKLQASYSVDKSFHMPVTPAAAVIPATVEQVAAVVKLCAAHKVPMTPRGAGSGLEGGAIPYAGGVVIDTCGLQRMDFDVKNTCVWVGAGVPKLKLLKSAREHGLLFGPDPSSNPCVGGMVSTAGSGMSTLKYGTTRENVLSLRVVTPQGTVVETRKLVRKSSSGLDLTQLYCGSEGTLGVVCEVAFRLWPLLRHAAGGVATFDSTEDAVNAVVAMKRQGAPTTLLRCELLNKRCVEASNSYSKLSLPLRATVLLEFSDDDASLRRIRADFKTVERIFRSAGKTRDVRFLKSGAEMDGVWEARRSCYFASMFLRGKAEKVLTTDVCVPLTELAAVIRETEEDFAAHNVPCLVCAHISDGNFHISVPFKDAEERREMLKLENRMIKRVVLKGGTISGEHGLGVGKVRHVTMEHGEAHICVQEKIKAALDPDNLMNPGAFYPKQQELYPTAHL